MLVCLDTQVLVWGVQKKASENRIEMIDRAERFLSWLTEQKAIVLVPSVVLGEYLVGVPRHDHAQTLRAFQSSFAVAPFDTATAAIAANLWLDYKARQAAFDTKAAPARSIIKADCQIVATAVARQANVLYSDDKHLADLANGRLRVEPLPTMPAQSRLL